MRPTSLTPANGVSSHHDVYAVTTTVTFTFGVATATLP